MKRAALILTLLLATAGSAAAPTTPSWHWPVEAPRVVVRPFIAPPTPYASGHRGIDVTSAESQFFAPADGVVHFSGAVAGRAVLSIRHPGGLISSYEPIQSTMKKGDVVARGDSLGIVVAGHCTSPCLHFGVRLNGNYVSPLLYLGGLEPSVLLPTRR